MFKFDGDHLQAHKLNGIARLYTRGGHNRTHRFSQIAREGQGLPVENLILDGFCGMTSDGHCDIEL